MKLQESLAAFGLHFSRPEAVSDGLPSPGRNLQKQKSVGIIVTLKNTIHLGVIFLYFVTLSHTNPQSQHCASLQDCNQTSTSGSSSEEVKESGDIRECSRSLCLNFALILMVDAEQTAGSNGFKPPCKIFPDF